MPGVVVTTSVRTGPSANAAAPASTFFVVGQAERGSTTSPTLVRSLADFERQYGGYVTYGWLHPTVRTFFEEGGSQAYVGRVVGASAAASSLTLVDRAGSPLNTIQIAAVDPGVWGDAIEVSVDDGVTPDTFIVNLYYDGTLIYSTGERLTPASAVDAINNNTTASSYVVATDLGSTSTSGNDIPAVLATTALTGGDDDRGAILAINYVEALDLFTEDLGAGAVAIPGQTGSTIIQGLVTHGVGYNRIAIGGFDQGESEATVVAEVSDYSALTNAEYLAMYWPWVKIPSSAGTLTIPADGYVAAKRTVAQNEIGPWQAPAGTVARATFVTGIETPVSATTGDALDAAKINAIRIIQGGVRIYGARACSDNTDEWRYLTFRDTLNYFVTEAERTLEDLLFSPIDGRGALFARVESRLVALLEPIRRAGGLYDAIDADGNLVDPGYSVRVNDALNPVTQLAEGRIVAEVGMRLSSVGDQIVLRVTKSNLTSTVV